MARVLIIGPNGRLERLLIERLPDSPAVDACYGAPWPEGNGFGDAIQNGQAGFVEAYGIDTVVYSPLKAGRKKAAPDLSDAARVFQFCARAGIKHLLVLS